VGPRLWSSRPRSMAKHRAAQPWSSLIQLAARLLAHWYLSPRHRTPRAGVRQLRQEHHKDDQSSRSIGTSRPNICALCHVGRGKVHKFLLEVGADLGDSGRDGLCVSGLEVEAEQRFGVRRSQVEPPVPTIDG